MNSFATAVSGLTGSSMWMDAIASNIANARDTGPIPATPPSVPVPPSTSQQPAVYQAVTVSFTSVANGPSGVGGVSVHTTPVLPSYSVSYDPSGSFANKQGMVASPNVDLADQMVNAVEATANYRANLAVIKAATKMADTTLNALA